MRLLMRSTISSMRLLMRSTISTMRLLMRSTISDEIVACLYFSKCLWINHNFTCSFHCPFCILPFCCFAFHKMQTPNHRCHLLQVYKAIAGCQIQPVSWTSANLNRCMQPVTVMIRGVGILQNAKWWPAPEIAAAAKIFTPPPRKNPVELLPRLHRPQDVGILWNAQWWPTRRDWPRLPDAAAATAANCPLPARPHLPSPRWLLAIAMSILLPVCHQHIIFFKLIVINDSIEQRFTSPVLSEFHVFSRYICFIWGSNALRIGRKDKL